MKSRHFETELNISLEHFNLGVRNCARAIEIIDIECVYSYLQIPEVANFARLQGVRIVFSTAKFAKIFISRLKMEKSFTKKKKCLKTHSSGLFYEKQ